VPSPSPGPSPIPAATPARRCAFDVVRRVFERGSFADVAFRVEADRHGLSGRERAFAMQLVYGTVQRRATLDHLAEQLSGRSVEQLDPPVLAALRLGLYQLIYLEGVADHAAVSESVELAKGGRGGHRLVNAVLRRATREAADVLAELDDSNPEGAALLHSHPEWVAKLWWRMLGPEQAVVLMKRDNEAAENAARANTLRATAADVISALAAEGVAARQGGLVPEAVVLDEPYDVHGSALFEQGMLMPQSRASMLVAHVLGPTPGERVLDLCAAPGAKTSQIAALMRDSGSITAVDLDQRRVRAIDNNNRRLGVSIVEARAGDASRPDFGEGYDRVLVDPPCSDLGTLQSRPDVRWRKQPAQVEDLARLQGGILDVGAAAVRPGGRLVYSTCTISEQENHRQITAFLDRHREFSPIDLSAPYPDLVGRAGDGFVQTLPHRDGTDGFFIAAVERTAG
jgi:16S rRNA (cytosine967-C5)-methyltransferase